MQATSPTSINFDQYEIPHELPLEAWDFIFSFLPHSQIEILTDSTTNNSQLMLREKKIIFKDDFNKVVRKVYSVARVCKAFYLATVGVRARLFQAKQHIIFLPKFKIFNDKHLKSAILFKNFYNPNNFFDIENNSLMDKGIIHYLEKEEKMENLRRKVQLIEQAIFLKNHNLGSSFDIELD